MSFRAPSHSAAPRDVPDMKRIAPMLLPLAWLACEPSSTDTPLSLAPRSVEVGSPSTSPSAPEADAPTLTVVTFNVNYGLAGCDAGGACVADEETLSALDGLDADLVLLQETNDGWQRALASRLGSELPHSAFQAPQKLAPGGMGVLSRYPIEEAHVLDSPVGWFPAQRLVVRAPGGPLQVLNVHLRPMVSESGSWVSGYFSTDHYRTRELDAYLPTLDRTLPTLVAGDFNEDVHNEGLRGLLDLGFESALAERDPGAKTWRWQGVPVTLRLDHVVCDRRAFEIVSAEVIQRGNSDHLPVKVVLRPRAG